MTGKVATAEIHIDAPAERVWEALTDPDQIAQYMFGARVEARRRPSTRGRTGTRCSPA